MRQENVDGSALQGQHGGDLRAGKKAGLRGISAIRLGERRVQRIIRPIEPGHTERLCPSGHQGRLPRLDVLEVVPLAPPRLDVSDRRGPIVIAVDPVYGSRQRAILAHIAHLQHQLAVQRRHERAEILASRLLGRFEPPVDIAKDGHSHGGPQLARRSDKSRGGFLRKMASSSMTHSRRSLRDGISYMMSSITSSRIERRPRAPVLRRAASLATARSASSAKDRWIFSYSKSFWNCFTRAFLGSTRIRCSSSSPSSSRLATTGSRPTNSGMRPYLRKSSGWHWLSTSCVSSILPSRLAVKPMVRLPIRSRTMRSRPTKAPPQMNRIL